MIGFGKKNVEVLQENSKQLAKVMEKNFQGIIDKQNEYFNQKLQELEPILRKYIKEEVRDQLIIMKQNGDI